MRSTHKFYRTGQPFEGKKSDISMDIFRSDLINIKNWPKEEKAEGIKFLSRIESMFNAFATELRKELTS